MDKIASAPGKVLSALSPTLSIKSNDSNSLEPDAPGEYRNLLMDMCGQKSDHILWINCLKGYDWYGEGRFSFNMDKFGVPVLKNGDYKLNLSIECVDRYVNAFETEEHKIYWEGNYWSPTEDDCVIVSVETEAILINKASNVLKHLGILSGDSVLVILPFIIQLPIVLMACIRVGAVFTLFNATIEDPEDLANAIKLANPKLIITADGFWSGAHIVPLKKNIDEALEIASQQYSINPKVVLIRHAASDPTIPQNTQEIVVGKRPIIDLEVPFDPERDFHWASLILGASDSCEVVLMNTEDRMVQHIRKRKDEWIIRNYTTSQMALLAAVFKHALGEVASGAVWPILDADNLILVTSLLAIPMSSSSLLLFEGKLDFPNPERLWSIITKYKVEKILLNIDSTRLLMENEIDMANVSARSLKVIFTVFTSQEDTVMASEWIKNTFPMAKHIAIVY
uniref:AMP-dependent synthetase/ligase domain-containing protein n=1 Tax=Panagrolaimus sp. ES5 TaxID=591445 RepID=A0AC34GUG1_9BILA